MTESGPAIPVEIFDAARAVSSCSRYPASTFGGPVFAGLLAAGDIQSTHKQELIIAYLMGLTRLLVEKGAFTQAEFTVAVQGWLDERKAWAQELANEVVVAWNQENPEHAQPELNANDLGFHQVEPPAAYPFWPWMYPTTTPA